MAAVNLTLASTRRGSVPHAAGNETFDRRLGNAGRAAQWLAGHGLAVIELRLDRSAAVLRVAPAPGLWRMFRGECAWRRREQRGALTVFTWFATIFGTRVEWEEVQCK